MPLVHAMQRKRRDGPVAVVSLLESEGTIRSCIRRKRRPRPEKPSEVPHLSNSLESFRNRICEKGRKEQTPTTLPRVRDSQRRECLHAFSRHSRLSATEASIFPREGKGDLQIQNIFVKGIFSRKREMIFIDRLRLGENFLKIKLCFHA